MGSPFFCGQNDADTIPVASLPVVSKRTLYTHYSILISLSASCLPQITHASCH